MTDPEATTPTSFKEALEALPPRHRAFVLAYVGDPQAKFNATRAALKAGYKNGRGIYEQASALLRKPEVRRAIDLGLEEGGMSPAVALARLEEHANASIEDLLTFTEVRQRWPVEMPCWEAKLWLESEIGQVENALLEAQLAQPPDPQAEREYRSDLAKLRRMLAILEGSHREDAKPVPDQEMVTVPGPLETRVVASIDLAAARERGKLHLVKRLEFTPQGPKVELWPVPEALQTILRKHGALINRTDVTSGGQPIKVVEVSDADV
jgi:hypothetical protein